MLAAYAKAVSTEQKHRSSLEQVSFPVSSLAYVLASILALLAAHVDLKTHRVPNALTLTCALLGLGLALGVGGLPGLAGALVGFAVAFGLLLPGYLLGFTGGGDLKLMAGLGCFLGPKLSLYAVLLYYPLGAVVALVFAVYAAYAQGRTGPFARYRTMARTLFRCGRLSYVKPSATESMGARLPMAPVIACAVLAVPFLFG